MDIHLSNKKGLSNLKLESLPIFELIGESSISRNLSEYFRYRLITKPPKQVPTIENKIEKTSHIKIYILQFYQRLSRYLIHHPVVKSIAAAGLIILTVSVILELRGGDIPKNKLYKMWNSGNPGHPGFHIWERMKLFVTAVKLEVIKQEQSSKTR